MADEIKHMDIKEFREFGYLQELNRVFLHPLGLALEVEVLDDGTERLSGIWDYRDDPEGIVYGDEVLDPVKHLRVMGQRNRLKRSRIEKLGYTVQPTPSQRGD